MIDRKRHISREKLLFRYSNALEHGDFNAIAAILDEAQNDPILERMILEINEFAVDEAQNEQVYRAITDPSEQKINRLSTNGGVQPGRKFSLTLAVAAMIAVVFSAMLIVNSLRNRTDIMGVYWSVEDANTAVFLRYTEDVWNQGNVNILDEVLTPDHVRHDSSFSDDIVGIEANAQLITSIRVALPDLHLDIQDITADDDQVWAYIVLTGTHTGELSLPDGMSIAPTGATVSIRMMVISRFKDGKIAELRAEYDGTGWLQQIGVIPALQQLVIEAQNRALARRVIDELWNGANLNLDSVRELYAMPFTFHWPTNQGPVTRTIGITYDYFMNLHSALPDIRLTVEHIYARGDLVVVHYTIQGTHLGTLGVAAHNVQIPPSGDEVSWDGVMMYRIRESKIVEEWWYWDNEYVTRAVLENHR